MPDYQFFFERIVAHANDSVIVTKAEPQCEPGPEIVYVNEAFTKLTGYASEEAIGRSPRFLQGEGTDPESLRVIREALAARRPVRHTILNYAKSGEACWLDLNIVPLITEQGWTSHFAAIQRDVTLEVQREQELAERASTDALTGAHNRQGFLERANHEIDRAKRYDEPLSLAALDFDHFKSINDTYGHPAGDAVLQGFSEKCHSILRSTDVFARIGGEEFVVLMPNTSPNAAYATLERVRQTIAATPVQWNDHSIQCSVSIGIAEYVPSDSTIEAVLQRADAALYQAKADGRNCIVDGTHAMQPPELISA